MPKSGEDIDIAFMHTENENVKEGESLLNVVLFQPEIPQNTGNIGRLCAYTGIHLHLIHPLGFSLSQKNLKRSGMDYWNELKVTEHKNWKEFQDFAGVEPDKWVLTTRGKKLHWDAEYRCGDYLIFGNEGSGCSEEIHQSIPEDRKLKIPQLVPGLRSLNLATSVGIVVYESVKKLKKNVKIDVY